MSDRPDLIYEYDGSYEGLLCCVYESVYGRETPGQVIGPEETTLFETKRIITNASRARRVQESFDAKIRVGAGDFVRDAYLTCLDNKEVRLIRFLKMAYRVGSRAMDMLTDENFARLNGAVIAMGREAHLLKGFVRFSDYAGVYVAEISPKNRVLPIIAEHFAQRFNAQPFMIYDKTHKEALAAREGRLVIGELAELTLAAPDERERQWRELWREFYRTIAVEGRENPRLRMSLMPKRYWGNMTEFQTDAPVLPAPAGAEQMRANMESAPTRPPAESAAPRVTRTS